MLNRDRLNNLNDMEYQQEMKMYENCTVKSFVDFEGWLNSSDEEYPIIGSRAVLKEANGTQTDCVKVDKQGKVPMDYVRLVVKLKGLHCFKQILVPKTMVEVI